MDLVRTEDQSVSLPTPARIASRTVIRLHAGFARRVLIGDRDLKRAGVKEAEPGNEQFTR